MKKCIVLALSCLFVSACVTPPVEEGPPPQWKEYFSSVDAVAFVDLNTQIWDVAGEGLKTSSILINYTQADAEGTHSAIMPFVLDCKNEMVKIERFTTYDGLDAQGNVVKEKEAPEEGFLPLESFLNGEKIRDIICTVN